MRFNVLLVLALAASGCAGTVPANKSDRPRVVVLPFENVGGGSEAARTVTRICQSLLASDQRIDFVEPGAVEEALVRLRIRVPVLMTESQRDSLQSAIDCDYALTGSVLSFKEASHPHAGRVGLVSFTLQVLDMRTGRVAWSKAASRQGSDGQWLFGLGVQRDPAVMANAMCRGLLKDINWRRLRP
jgi:TolB-like protein